MAGRRRHESEAADCSPRLFVEQALGDGADVALAAPQAHYLRNVLRLGEGADVRLFNGRDGEWRATLSELGRKGASVRCTERTRAQEPLADVHYLFAPLKHARLDYMVQKATEMGAALLQPVTTDFTNVGRVNEERMRSNAVEAAEQCNLLAIPAIRAPARLDAVLEDWPSERRVVYCDEAAETASPVATLAALPRGPLAVLVGPEGGFSPRERGMLRARDGVTAISLGPRVMRADTAAVAALALVQAVLGDWN